MRRLRNRSRKCARDSSGWICVRVGPCSTKGMRVSACGLTINEQFALRTILRGNSYITVILVHIETWSDQQTENRRDNNHVILLRSLRLIIAQSCTQKNVILPLRKAIKINLLMTELIRKHDQFYIFINIINAIINKTNFYMKLWCVSH